MTPRITKKSVILAWIRQHQPAQAGRLEVRAIREELARALGPRGRISDEYLLSVLDEAGVTAASELRGISPELFHSLHFGSLAAAEATLRTLHERYQAARAAGGEAGKAITEECRRAALLVRTRAERIARGRKTDALKRAQKEEIARWFAIWLQTPELFLDWLALRKQTAEFRKLAGEGP